MKASFRPCIIVPTYDNPRTIEAVVEAARAFLPDVIVVDDGSGAEGYRACRELEASGQARVVHRSFNGGKGAAVKTGLAVAQGLGFTHAVQIDADGQHDLSFIPELIARGREDPDAFVVGCPRYDESAPAARRWARRFTQLWVNLEVGRGVVEDTMVGFRLYPIAATLASGTRGDRMDFDVEVVVRMAWRGTPIVNLPVPVRYLSAEEGGVSHFQPFRDNLRFSWMHSRLCTEACVNWARRRFGRGSAHETKAKDWLSVPERGTLAGIFAVAWMATAFGRGPARALVAVVALWFARDPKVRRASEIWWEAVDGERPSFGKVYRHVRRFANVTLDRLFLLMERHQSLEFVSNGNEHLEGLARENKGAVLLGAHIGSFEAMRLRAGQRKLSLNIVGNFENARMVNAVLGRSSSKLEARVIKAAPGDVGFVFDIQDRVARGELVAILGDRVAKGQDAVVVEFFGRPARFPTGPFMLASILRCPIYLTFGVFREPNLYQLSCEPFAEQLDLPRRRRQEALQEHVQRYARALEAKARSAPDNWFNFYDFWEVP